MKEYSQIKTKLFTQEQNNTLNIVLAFISTFLYFLKACQNRDLVQIL